MNKIVDARNIENLFFVELALLNANNQTKNDEAKASIEKQVDEIQNFEKDGQPADTGRLLSM